jgi:hypothetical protein
MIGELSIGGVYIPTLLLFACLAVLLVGLVSRLLSFVGFYRLVAYRPMADLALLVLLLAALVWLTEGWGVRI